MHADVFKASGAAQSVGTRNRMVVGSTPVWTTIDQVWTGGWRGVGSPLEHLQSALEQGTKPLHCSLTPLRASLHTRHILSWILHLCINECVNCGIFAVVYKIGGDHLADHFRKSDPYILLMNLECNPLAIYLSCYFPLKSWVLVFLEKSSFQGFRNPSRHLVLNTTTSALNPTSPQD